jgi:hypothetical protein
MAGADSFEKLGVFYLGRAYDSEKATATGAPFLYDSRHLTTHGLIVGMTGSGKTGLSIVLLEEAALDGIPAIVIDPKGDMGNLALQFPELAPADFLPWIEPSEAERKGETVSKLARETAAQWESGLLEWGQSRARIRSLKEAAEVSIYTPGSTSCRPIAALKSFAAPPEAVRSDEDALRERAANAVSGLLGLVGIEADPVTSREHVLLASLLERSWRASEGATLESLVRAVTTPPFDKLGVLDLESFYPEKERLALAAKLNSLLASPAFSAWREGEPLDVSRLLFTSEGKPRLSVFTIAHLGDEARMFFVTLLLNEVVAWMRTQAGTGSLRALLYMDEIFGFFPPVKAPPSKPPMLTLLKQARAFGLGVVLATQNPVDLDYRGLANIGTWFLGRLQTERDRERLMEGLAAASGGFDREKAEKLLSSLPKRVFLMQNVHEDGPILFQTRWAISYLRGPLTLEQVKRLTGATAEPDADRSPLLPTAAGGGARPHLPPAIDECFLAGTSSSYRPAILATVRLHFVQAANGIDHWETIHFLTPIGGLEREPDWTKGSEIEPPALEPAPASGAGFGPIPIEATREKSYEVWEKSLLAFLYRERKLSLQSCASLGITQTPGEREADFRVRLNHRLREKRDEAVLKLGRKYAAEQKRLREAVERAEARREREATEYEGRKLDTVVDFGMTLAGALFGRKLGSLTNLGRASRTARSASRASRERDDVRRAEENLEAQKENLLRLESELAEGTRALAEAMSAERLELETLRVAPRKSDLRVERFALAWDRSS